ncbi:pyridoxal phosphate-dependent aminotransferase [Aneurinibacillus sp. Ricciae_BoGa-3]|uniref:MalY/PatB family protein n=1 Tax=Aneurinibacillus sp. Ricciae_BoGa-3 TaxID=3022697 RepID=UPI0023426E44|nr:MalY/PatB family protein [Aneurinibacillus sp. Ricciae_BoGa-3]WCK55557.1 pyridoxal phosphate-dependent aminotransferase [Aneurinibacillus sp. Ricciae_BoGa-3]
MEYNFDEVIVRTGFNSLKWDDAERLFGDKAVLPMWVADMDFKVATPIIDAIKERAEHGIFGYATRSDSYYQAVCDWLAKRHNWPIEKDWVVFSPGVVPALRLILDTFTNPGDKIVVQTPVYTPMFQMIKDNGRFVVENPLVYDPANRHYSMDIEDLRSKIDCSVKLLFLCSPHNPVGRVWTKKELAELADICLENDVLIISDEIHSDLVYAGFKHIPIASLSQEIANLTITCTAPSKTFNLAGLQTSNLIIPNKELRQRYVEKLNSHYLKNTNTFGIVALEAAYREGEEWLDQLIAYLHGNLTYLTRFLQRNIPQIKVIQPEATYLVWLDCRELGLSKVELQQFMLKKAKIAFNHGYIFGQGGEGFVRMNIACPRTILEDALNRLLVAIRDLESLE